MAEPPITRRSPAEFAERCADLLTEALRQSDADLRNDIPGVILSLRVFADLERKGL